MSDVERFWAALANKGFPNWKPWHELHPMDQMQIIQGINLILSKVA